VKPGQFLISIAINEMSKIKSLTLISFHNHHRLLGEELVEFHLKISIKGEPSQEDCLWQHSWQGLTSCL